MDRIYQISLASLAYTYLREKNYPVTRLEYLMILSRYLIKNCKNMYVCVFPFYID